MEILSWVDGQLVLLYHGVEYLDAEKIKSSGVMLKQFEDIEEASKQFYSQVVVVMNSFARRCHAPDLPDLLAIPEYGILVSIAPDRVINNVRRLKFQDDARLVVM